MKISVVMPVYNEAKTIAEVVRKVERVPFDKEIIIVNDGSIDGTGGILAELQKSHIKIIHHEKNKGKGAALRTGFQHVTGDIVIVQDADLEGDVKEYPELIAPIIDGFADVVYGSRLLGAKVHRVNMFWHKVANTLLTLFTNILYNAALTDMETGYKVFRRGVVEKLDIKSDDFAVEPEITAKVFKRRYRVYEVPISYYGRTYEEGKKIKRTDFFRAVWALLKYRFVD